MKTLLIAFLLLCSAPAWATSYYLSPSGSDGAAGTSTGTAWLSPNHALNCGDTITAASGSYSYANFTSGKWGTVTCAGNNNVAWLICGTFDACKISSASSSSGMWLDKSYWGVVGWEITTSTGTTASCFQVKPSSTYILHHIIIANNVANGCINGGITAYDLSTSASVDYLVFVGNVVYNAAQTSAVCASGISVYQPIANDTATGTHIFIAGNFTFSNLDPSTCNGTAPTDGEGINMDTFDFDQGGGTAYQQQAVVKNNISVNNGGRCIETEYNSTGGAGNAPIFVNSNTCYGNMQDPNQNYAGLGEFSVSSAYSITATGNIFATKAAVAPAGNTVYALSVYATNSTSSIAGNWLYGVGGNTSTVSSSTGFSLGTNTTATSPAFNSTTAPGAPSCSGQTNTATCMATMISNFTPTASGSATYGYQTVSNTSITDALFPQWLCTTTGVLNANIPAGLITPGCGVLSGSSIGSLLTSGIKITAGSKIQ